MSSQPARLSLFQRHAREWGSCTRCELCETRRNVVLARGKVPCDVLFVGEGPGESEDVLAKPFVGPAGKLLDLIIERSILPPLTYALTNLVACIPRVDGGKADVPPEESIEACKPRLEEFIAICNPKLVVAVGAIARDFLKPGYVYSIKLPSPRPKVIDITHPAAILRSTVVRQGLDVQRCIVTIENAADSVFGEGRAVP